MSIDTTPTLEARFRELEERVMSYGSGSLPISHLVKLNMAYIVIPTVVALLLAAMKPAFLYDTSIQGTKIFSYRKMVVGWLILSAIVCVGYYAYKYRKT